VETVYSTWCDEALFDGSVPQDLKNFVAEFLIIVTGADCAE